MKSITDFDVTGKKVLLRCDLNVTIKNGTILNDDKIVASLETINYLVGKNAKVIIVSHLGKVKTEEDKKSNSLKLVFDRLENLINTKIMFSEFTSGVALTDMVNQMENGEVVLVENTRFEDLDGKKESGCDDGYSKYLASLADIMIDDAFGMSHRRHASNYGVKKYLDWGIGFLVQKELEGLEPLMNPESPFTVLMGGAKVSDKTLLIDNILKRCDYLLVGGGIANTFLKVDNKIGKSLYSEDSVDYVKNILNTYSNKVIMPVDVIVENNGSVNTKLVSEILDDDIIYDIGPRTTAIYKEYINNAKTTFINGTVGLYEEEPFSIGTKEMLKSASLSKAKVILGGGDALASADKLGIDGFYHKSTGGGATLDYIGTGKLASMESVEC